MEKTELIAEIIRLYDKVNELQTIIKVGENACAPAPVESADKGLDKLKVRLFNDYFDYSKFKDYVVATWRLPNIGNNTSYENWYNNIGWDAFKIKFGNFSLDEMKALFAEQLRQCYSESKKGDEE